MSIRLECDSCGHRHRMGDRVFDEENSRMVCPDCGDYSFTVDCGDISWHPSSEE